MHKQRAETAADSTGRHRGRYGHSERAAARRDLADGREAAEQGQSGGQSCRALRPLVSVDVVAYRQVGLVLEIAYVANDVPKLGFYCATVREQVDLVSIETSEMEVLDRILELVSIGEHPDCLADLAVDRILAIRPSDAAH